MSRRLLIAALTATTLGSGIISVAQPASSQEYLVAKPTVVDKVCTFDVDAVRQDEAQERKILADHASETRKVLDTFERRYGITSEEANKIFKAEDDSFEILKQRLAAKHGAVDDATVEEVTKQYRSVKGFIGFAAEPGLHSEIRLTNLRSGLEHAVTIADAKTRAYAKFNADLAEHRTTKDLLHTIALPLIERDIINKHLILSPVDASLQLCVEAAKPTTTPTTPAPAKPTTTQPSATSSQKTTTPSTSTPTKPVDPQPNPPKASGWKWPLIITSIIGVLLAIAGGIFQWAQQHNLIRLPR
ncbi:hypothetical protein [Corynebacterium sp. HS2168-gen11]|uniref:hypothetical protein n=1 Tax=Corynebacterium sp. HS2168-gen11 TaxID=2974027 RepID=UPI00216AB477|nr:hypothetical protein [Corynebacterium sp. HS2168-gen11]MCS4535376.1 hypothetical protein [Corynebacterium sp. HS2168-gen11]